MTTSPGHGPDDRPDADQRADGDPAAPLPPDDAADTTTGEPPDEPGAEPGQMPDHDTEVGA